MFDVIFRLAFRGLFRLGFRLLGGGLRVQGRGVVPTEGGVLLCPNHLCDADPAAVFAALPRRARYMAKEELFAVPVLGTLLRRGGAFPIRRDSADRTALRRAEEMLRAGEAVVIFPEGGGNFEGTLQPLHPGAMLVALRARVPVIPVALVNTNRVWPYGAPTPRYAGDVPVRVTFGEPLDLSDLHGKKGAVEEATRRLTERLAAMLGQPVPEGKPKNRTAEDEEAARAAISRNAPVGGLATD